MHLLYLCTKIDKPNEIKKITLTLRYNFAVIKEYRSNDFEVIKTIKSVIGHSNVFI